MGLHPRYLYPIGAPTHHAAERRSPLFSKSISEQTQTGNCLGRLAASFRYIFRCHRIHRGPRCSPSASSKKRGPMLVPPSRTIVSRVAHLRAASKPRWCWPLPAPIALKNKYILV